MSAVDHADIDDLDVRRLRLAPGDIVIITCRKKLGSDAVGMIKAAAESVIRDHPVMVLDAGLEMSVASPACTDPAKVDAAWQARLVGETR